MENINTADRLATLKIQQLNGDDVIDATNAQTFPVDFMGSTVMKDYPKKVVSSSAYSTTQSNCQSCGGVEGRAHTIVLWVAPNEEVTNPMVRIGPKLWQKRGKFTDGEKIVFNETDVAISSDESVSRFDFKIIGGKFAGCTNLSNMGAGGFGFVYEKPETESPIEYGTFKPATVCPKFKIYMETELHFSFGLSHRGVTIGGLSDIPNRAPDALEVYRGNEAGLFQELTNAPVSLADGTLQSHIPSGSLEDCPVKSDPNPEIFGGDIIFHMKVDECDWKLDKIVDNWGSGGRNVLETLDSRSPADVDADESRNIFDVTWTTVETKTIWLEDISPTPVFQRLWNKGQGAEDGPFFDEVSLANCGTQRIKRRSPTNSNPRTLLFDRIKIERSGVYELGLIKYPRAGGKILTDKLISTDEFYSDDKYNQVSNHCNQFVSFIKKFSVRRDSYLRLALRKILAVDVATATAASFDLYETRLAEFLKPITDLPQEYPRYKNKYEEVASCFEHLFSVHEECETRENASNYMKSVLNFYKTGKLETARDLASHVKFKNGVVNILINILPDSKLIYEKVEEICPWCPAPWTPKQERGGNERLLNDGDASWGRSGITMTGEDIFKEFNQRVVYREERWYIGGTRLVETSVGLNREIISRFATDDLTVGDCLKHPASPSFIKYLYDTGPDGPRFSYKEIYDNDDGVITYEEVYKDYFRQLQSMGFCYAEVESQLANTGYAPFPSDAVPGQLNDVCCRKYYESNYQMSKIFGCEGYKVTTLSCPQDRFTIGYSDTEYKIYPEETEITHITSIDYSDLFFLTARRGNQTNGVFTLTEGSKKVKGDTTNLRMWMKVEPGNGIPAGLNEVGNIKGKYFMMSKNATESGERTIRFTNRYEDAKYIQSDFIWCHRWLDEKKTEEHDNSEYYNKTSELRLITAKLKKKKENWDDSIELRKADMDSNKFKKGDGIFIGSIASKMTIASVDTNTNVIKFKQHADLLVEIDKATTIRNASRFYIAESAKEDFHDGCDIKIDRRGRDLVYNEISYDPDTLIISLRNTYFDDLSGCARGERLGDKRGASLLKNVKSGDTIYNMSDDESAGYVLPQKNDIINILWKVGIPLHVDTLSDLTGGGI